MEPLQVEAVYEGGILKPDQVLPLEEHQRVLITVIPAVNQVRSTAGMLGWTGDSETLERIALDPEFGVEESR
jgi:predicted DNA-binding antitoxin AbrB/MazE fold protein